MEPAFNQAEEMLRRVSPEGRAVAYRERVERQRRTMRRFGLIILLGLLLGFGFFLLMKLGVPIGSPVIVGAIAVFLAGCAAILFGLRSRKVSIASLPAIPLTALPPKVGEWLDQQRALLPPSALPLIDKLNRHLSPLSSQLASIEPHGPGATAIRKLIAVELPELVDRYRNIPSAVERAEANTQLIDGLSIIDGEIVRLSDDLASGSFDALATQNRYLQLKYEVGLSGS
jgi:hypothetical protein